MDYRNFFQDKISDLKAKNLYRTPKKPQKGLVNFCSNDYLNLSENKSVKNAALKAIEKFGVGAKASKYVFDENGLAVKLEKTLSRLKNCDDTIVLGSGYLTNIGIVAALVSKNDLIIADKLIHSSLLDGAKLSGAKLIRFKHNDVEDCERILNGILEDKSNLQNPSLREDIKLEKNQGKILIITETVFSMDGDLGRIDELLALSRKYNCLFLTDDAHGLGIVKQNYSKYDFHLQCGTLSKAVGSYGGYVCGSDLMIDYLRNTTKPAIYSTALPPSVLAASLKAVEIIEKDQKLGKRALENAQYFCELMNLPKPQSTIVPMIIGESSKTLDISQKLKKAGFLISAIRPPTVEIGKSRLRITFYANHKKSEIHELIKAINVSKN
ncbi:MAG: 8-amino-7-oxononanoate synthase [Rickettsiales bacterium]|jgi:8-amino-7-oxononanoate synthase